MNAAARFAALATDGNPNDRSAREIGAGIAAMLEARRKPTSTDSPTLTRAEAISETTALAAAAKVRSADLERIAATAGPALSARIMALAGALETLAFDAGTLRLDLEQGNYPRSVAAESSLARGEG